MQLKRKISMIIFDLDGTFYPYDCVIRSNYENAVKFLSNALQESKETVEMRLSKNNIFSHISDNPNSITAYASSIGINMEKWNEYRKNNFFISNIPQPGDNTVNVSVIKKIQSMFKLILLTSNTISIVLQILEKLEVPKDLFLEILASESFNDLTRPFNKADAFAVLSSKYHTAFSEMLSIGDRYTSDIKPMIELGGIGVVIQHPRDITEICNGLLNNEVYVENANYRWYL